MFLLHVKWCYKHKLCLTFLFQLKTIIKLVLNKNMQQNHISLHLSPVLNHIPIFGKGFGRIHNAFIPGNLWFPISDYLWTSSSFSLICQFHFRCTTLRSLCITVDTIIINRFHFFFFTTIWYFYSKFLLQKPKLLMKYFIFVFSYIMDIISNNRL